MYFLDLYCEVKGSESVTRKSMDLKQFNAFMKRCNTTFGVRYVTPTIHARVSTIVAITIHTSDESKEFTITNNPDENFDLNVAVNEYLDELNRNEPFGTIFV
jgi:hypothetical protein